MENLIEFLEKVRDREYPNETAVRSQIVQPILERLGWPVDDACIVHHEYSLRHKKGSLRVDIALCVSPAKPRCIIELKGPNHVQGGNDQLFEYSFHVGAPLALLTNGRHWRLYHIFQPGTYDERLVCTRDLSEHSTSEVAEFLDRYISYRNTCSEKASQYALDDLKKRINRQNAKSKIPEAWDRLVGSDPDDRLANLIIDEASKVSDYAPAKNDVVAFLQSLQPSGAQSSVHSQNHSLPPLLSQKPKSKKRTTSKISRESIHYHLKGVPYQEQNAKRAYVSIITELGKEDGFLQCLEPRMCSSRKKQISRDKFDIFHTGKRSEKIHRSWYLNTNLSNKQKIKYLKIACEVAGIVFGHRDGLKIELPNG